MTCSPNGETEKEIVTSQAADGTQEKLKYRLYI